MKAIRSGTLFAILGILCGPVLLNLAGFFSPILASFLYSGDASSHSLDLLVLTRIIAEPLTLLMVVAAWLLTPHEPEESSAILVWRMLVRISAIAWAVTSILAAFGNDSQRLKSIAWTAFIVFGFLQIARICRQLQRDRLAAAAVVLLVVAVAASLLPPGDPYSAPNLFFFTGLRLLLSVTATVGVIIVLGAVRRNTLAA